MNLAAVFAMLVEMGVCAPMHFTRPDHTALVVLVCPYTIPGTPDADTPTEPATPAPAPSKKRA